VRSLLELGRSGLPLAVICVSLSSGVARADSVTYTFTGSASLAGTTFSFTSPTGFISAPTGQLKVNPGGVLNAPFDLVPPTQTMASFAIFPDISVPSLEILALDTIEEGPAAFIPILPLDLSSFGAQEVNSPSHQIEGVFGTLVISPTAAAEPNSCCCRGCWDWVFS
jgi:hypothetical protein